MGCAVSAGGVSPPQQTTATTTTTSTTEIIQVTPASTINRAPAKNVNNSNNNGIAGEGEQQQQEKRGENCGRLSLSPVKNHIAPAGSVGRCASFTASHASAANEHPPRSESGARAAATATVSTSYLSPGLIETKPFRVLVIRNPIASSLLVTARERGQQSLTEKGREEKGEMRELGVMMISQNNDDQQGKKTKESALCDPVGLAAKENELFASDFAFGSSLVNQNNNAYSYSDRGVDKCLEMLAQEIVRRNNNARVYAASSSMGGGGAKNNKIGNPSGPSRGSSYLPPLISPRGAVNNAAGGDVAAAGRVPSLLANSKNSSNNDSKPKASGGVDAKGTLPPAVRNYYEQQQARREAATASSSSHPQLQQQQEPQQGRVGTSLMPNNPTLANSNTNNNSSDSKFDISLNDNDNANNNSNNNNNAKAPTYKGHVVGAVATPAPLYTVVEMCVTERNLVEEPLPKFTHEVMRALYRGASKTTHQREVTVLSDELISEVKCADLIIIGLPRYHNGAPSTFKNYIDLITRPKETFVYDESAQAVGLLGEKDITVWAVMTHEGVEEEERAVLLRVGSTLGIDVGQGMGAAGRSSASANSPISNSAIAIAAPLSDAGGGHPENDENNNINNSSTNHAAGAPNETCGGTIQLDVGGGTIAAVTTCSALNSPDVGAASVSPPHQDHHARAESVRTIPAPMKTNTSDLKNGNGNNNINNSVVDSATAVAGVKPPPSLLIPTNEAEVLSSSTGDLSLSPNLSSGNAAGGTVLSASIAKVSEEEYHQNLKTCLGFIGLKKVVFLPFDVTTTNSSNGHPQGLSPTHNNGTSSSYLLSTAVATGTNVVISSSSVVAGPPPPPPTTAAQCPLSNLCRGEGEPTPASSSAKPAAAVPSLLLPTHQANAAGSPSPRRTLSLAPASLASATPRGGNARGNSTLQQAGNANGVPISPNPDSALGKALTTHSKNVAKAIVMLGKSLGAQ